MRQTCHPEFTANSILADSVELLDAPDALVWEKERCKHC